MESMRAPGQAAKGKATPGSIRRNCEAGRSDRQPGTIDYLWTDTGLPSAGNCEAEGEWAV